MLSPNTHLKERYRILHKIGGGGFGYVYKAVDEVFGCCVAIKETREEVAGLNKLRKAFEREAKLLRNLKHESLPRVTDYFFEGQAQFLVMDFIEGEDLAARLKNRLIARQGPFTCQELMPWADKILAALEYLHNRPEPIIHRDIKPSNIKLTDDGEVYLLDFGLAKGAAGQMSTIIEGQTSSGVHGLTREYAPLEQWQNTDIEPQSDIYALGATLYHLLTGQLPVSAAQRDEAQQRGLGDPLRPAHQVNPSVAPAVSEVISQALAVRWWDRLGSAKEMRVALKHAYEEMMAQPAVHSSVPDAQDKIPTLTPPKRPEAASPDNVEPTPVTMLRHPWLRRSWLMPVIALVLLAGIVVTARLAFPQWFTLVDSAKPNAAAQPPENPRPPIAATPTDLRPRALPNAHTGSVWSVAFSPVGGLAASASADTTIILWETKDWTRIAQPLTGHTGAVYSVAFSPDGRLLASGSHDKTIKLWDTKTGQLMETLPPEHAKPVIRLAFSPDGDFLASIGSEPKNGDKEIRLWDARNGWKSKILEGHKNAVSAIAFSPDRQTLASAGYDNTLRLWNIRKAKESEVLKQSDSDQTCATIAFSADGKYLACGSSDKTIKLWLYRPETQSWSEADSLKAHTKPITSISFSPDNKTLASASEDGTVRVWDILTQDSKLLSVSQGGIRSLQWSAAFSPDGQTLLTGGEDHQVSVWQ